MSEASAGADRAHRSTVGRQLVVLGLVWLAATPGAAQDQSRRQGIWASLEMGYGSLDRSADQESRQIQGVFAMAFKLGVTPHRCVRLGIELNGWLLEAFDPHDPAVGESVSQFMVITQVYPWPARGWFLKAGVGRATYTNEHPLAFDSSGWGGTIGAGYDWPIGRKFALTPAINYSRGSLGHVDNLLTSVHGREYGVVDLGIGLSYPVGRQAARGSSTHH